MDISISGQDKYYHPVDGVPDPIFRAASIRIKNVAMANLIERDHKLYLLTAGHVARGAAERDGMLTKYYIPGVGEGNIITSNFKFSGKFGQLDDEFADYVLGDHNTKIIREAIQKGIITPLVLTTGELDPQDEVVMQNHVVGQWVPYKATMFAAAEQEVYIEKDPGFNTINGIVTSDHQGNCQGDSGSAALRRIGQKVTNQVAGVLIHGDPSGFQFTEPEMYDRLCSVKSAIRLTTDVNHPIQVKLTPLIVIRT
jgi:hypothetical protein